MIALVINQKIVSVDVIDNFLFAYILKKFVDGKYCDGEWMFTRII